MSMTDQTKAVFEAAQTSEQATAADELSDNALESVPGGIAMFHPSFGHVETQFDEAGASICSVQISDADTGELADAALGSVSGGHVVRPSRVAELNRNDFDEKVVCP